jgi:predicted peptidase
MLPRTFVWSSGTTLPYRTFIPEMPDSGRLYPLVVFLHEGSARGTDNISQISDANWHGAHVWTEADNQTRHPCFVVAPQLPQEYGWSSGRHPELSLYAAALVELLATLTQEFPIDAGRVYITGQSLGGRGTWDLVAKRPELFAAAVPVCGAGDPSAAAGFRDVPIWAFHGGQDKEIPVERSREMVAALRAAGATVRYTEYETLGHAIWDKAYAEPELVEWVFAQRRGE